ncbi:MFS transporter [Lentibacillus salinarum]|uniref:MFS transporter n=1 Tax=Lentibacillus salinarum TaxID=446820 RepID=A0ABW3ZXN5_9BACI
MNDEKQQGTVFETKQWMMLIVLTMSSFVVVLDFASMFIPLPTIMGDLGGRLDEATWVIAAFTLTFAVFLHPSAALANIYGERKVFLSGVTIFTIFSIACALAPSMEFLIGARVVLGIGAAMIEASVFALIKSSFSGKKQKLAFKVQGVAFILGALLGTPLSGAITTVLSWEYIFWLNVLVGIVVILITPIVITKSIPVYDQKMQNIAGLFFGGFGLFLLFFSIIEGSQFGWLSPVILASFGGSIVLLFFFVVFELRAQQPLVNLRLFNNRSFALGNFLRWASEFASMGIYFAISDFLQTQIGYSALITGLLLLTVIVGGMFAAPVTESLTKRLDARWLVVPGFLFVAIGTFWLAHVSAETAWVFFLAPLAIAGAGFVAQEDLSVNIRDRDILPEQSDAAWRISYSIFLLGVGLGISVVSAIWQSQLKANINEAEAINEALLSCVVVSLLGAIIALFITSKRKETSNVYK